MFYKGVLHLCLAATLTLSVSTAQAVALRPGKATDASVCDLGPSTTAFLGKQILVPAAASSKDKIAAYVRLAGAFVTENCSNGQLLILHGSTEFQSDMPALEEVANSSCVIAAVRRTEGRSTEGPQGYGTFELRCPISKVEDVKTRLQLMETQDPLVALKTRLAAAAAPSAGQKPAESGQAKKDCDKMTLGSLTLGGGCK